MIIALRKPFVAPVSRLIYSLRPKTRLNSSRY